MLSLNIRLYLKPAPLSKLSMAPNYSTRLSKLISHSFGLLQETRARSLDLKLLAVEERAAEAATAAAVQGSTMAETRTALQQRPRCG
jgi:hypothetical protein